MDENTLNKLMADVLSIIPGASFGEDSEGQILVFTIYKCVVPVGGIEEMGEWADVNTKG